MIYAIEEFWRKNDSRAEIWETFDKKRDAIDVRERWHHDNEDTYFKIVRYNCNRTHEYKWHDSEQKIIDYYFLGEYIYSVPTLSHIMELYAAECSEAQRKLMLKYIGKHGIYTARVNRAKVELVPVEIIKGDCKWTNRNSKHM